MNEQATQHHDRGFLTGLVLGGVIGAGLAMWLAPRAAAEIKTRAANSLKTLGNAVSERYRDAGRRVTRAVDDLTRTGRRLHDEARDTVVQTAGNVEHGAQDVQRFATDAKTPA
jgi:gas vesicle protein